MSTENDGFRYRPELEELCGKSPEECKEICNNRRDSIDRRMSRLSVLKEEMCSAVTSFSTSFDLVETMDTHMPDIVKRLGRLLDRVSLRIDSSKHWISGLSYDAGDTREDALRRIARVLYEEKSSVTSPPVWTEQDVENEFSRLKSEWCYEMVTVICSKIRTAEDARYDTVTTGKESANIESRSQKLVVNDTAASAMENSSTFTIQHAVAKMGHTPFPPGALGTPLNFFNAGIA
ncbi:hypothetical protein LTS18_008972, partial [Coniosporium uncinatum]